MAKKIDLIFENEDGKTVTYSLDNPIEPADPEAVNEAMDAIIDGNVFFTNGGEVVKKKAARIVERNVTNIEID